MTLEQIKNSLERRNFQVFEDALGNLWVQNENQLIKMHITTMNLDHYYEEKVAVDIDVGVPQTNHIFEKMGFIIDRNWNIREFDHKLSQVLEDIANSITKTLNQWQGIVDDIKSISDNLYNNVKQIRIMSKAIKTIAKDLSKQIDEQLKDKVDVNDIETAYEEFGRELIEQLIENQGIFGKFIEMHSNECDEDGYVTGMVTNNSVWWQYFS